MHCAGTHGTDSNCQQCIQCAPQLQPRVGVTPLWIGVAVVRGLGGVATDIVAMNIMREYAYGHAQELGLPLLPETIYLSMSDQDPEVRRELGLLSQPPRCLFDDMMCSAFPSFKQTNHAESPPHDFAQFMRMTLELDALLTHAYCFIHNKCCGYERAGSHHAGPSCIEFLCDWCHGRA